MVTFQMPLNYKSPWEKKGFHISLVIQTSQGTISFLVNFLDQDKGFSHSRYIEDTNYEGKTRSDINTSVSPDLSAGWSIMSFYHWIIVPKCIEILYYIGAG